MAFADHIAACGTVNPNAWVHEAGHVLDSNSGGVTGSSAWASALQADTCVGSEGLLGLRGDNGNDDHFRVETFAEDSIIWLANLWAGHPVLPNANGCMAQQMATYTGLRTQHPLMDQYIKWVERVRGGGGAPQPDGMRLNACLCHFPNVFYPPYCLVSCAVFWYRDLIHVNAGAPQNRGAIYLDL